MLPTPGFSRKNFDDYNKAAKFPVDADAANSTSGIAVTNDSPLLRSNNGNSVVNRLGPLRRPNFQNNRGNHHQSNFQPRFNVYAANAANNQDGGSRKRFYNNGKIGQNGTGKIGKRGHWGSKKPYYRKPKETPQQAPPQHISVQNRLERIRKFSNDSIHTIQSESENTNGNEEESQEDDDENITVQVINNDATQDNVSRFKLILDPKCQAAIKKIQSRKKDKQVVFPYPVPPHTTQVTMHERFSVL